MVNLHPAWFVDLLDRDESGLVRFLHRSCCAFYKYEIEDARYCPKCGEAMDDIEIRHSMDYRLHY